MKAIAKLFPSDLIDELQDPVYFEITQDADQSVIYLRPTYLGIPLPEVWIYLDRGYLMADFKDMALGQVSIGHSSTLADARKKAGIKEVTDAC